jgi:hypothetical protein|tara:strand:- start:720 stop:1094 length:375 start_codon:yes stop_codon:yes gene_type:complete
MQQILLFSRQKSRQLPKATIEEEKSAPLSETVSGTTFATAIETTSRDKSASLYSHRSFAVKAFIFTPTSLPPFRRREGEKQFCGVKMHREREDYFDASKNTKFISYLSSPQPKLVDSQSSWTFF